MFIINKKRQFSDSLLKIHGFSGIVWSKDKAIYGYNNVRFPSDASPEQPLDYVDSEGFALKRLIPREEYRRSCFFLLLVFCIGSGCGYLLGSAVSVCFVGAPQTISSEASLFLAFIQRLLSISLFPLFLIFADLTGNRGLFFPAFFCKGFLLCFSSVCLSRWTDGELLRRLFFRLSIHNLLNLSFSFYAASSLLCVDEAHRGKLLRKLWILFPLSALLSLYVSIAA